MATPSTVVPIRTERVTVCPACGSGRHTHWRENARDWEQPSATERFAFAACVACDARFQVLRPIEEDLPLVYFQGYGPYDARGQRPFGVPVSSFPLRAAGAALGAVASVAERLAPDPLPARLATFYAADSDKALLLDYGCGSARFLDEARERGWRTVGVDFVPEVTHVVAAAGHRAGIVADGLSAVLAGDEVRAVRMNHVVEHLLRPRESLAEIRDAMEPGGRIHIATPNPTSLGARLFRQWWFPLEAPRHAVIYPPATLVALLRDVGFRDIEVLHEVVTKDLARSWGIRRFDRGRIGHAEIHGLAGDPHLRRVLRPLAKAVALLGIADRFHVIART